MKRRDEASNAGSHRAALTECVRACGGSRRRHDQVRVTVGRGQPDLQQEQPVQARPAGGRRRLGRRHDLACQGQLRRAGVDREGSDPDRGRLRSEHDLRACHRARAGQPRVPEHRRDQQRRERSDEPVGCCRPRPWSLQQHRQGDLRHRRGVARDHAGGGQRHPRQRAEQRLQQRLRRRCRHPDPRLSTPARSRGRPPHHRPHHPDRLPESRDLRHQRRLDRADRPQHRQGHALQCLCRPRRNRGVLRVLRRPSITTRSAATNATTRTMGAARTGSTTLSRGAFS